MYLVEKEEAGGDGSQKTDFTSYADALWWEVVNI